MAEAILKDKKKILPCCVLAEGEYDVHSTFVGLPVKLGRSGVEEIVQINLTEKESEELQVSAGHVRELCKVIDSSGLL